MPKIRAGVTVCSVHFTPDNPHKVKFAHSSNVAIDAWAAQQAARLDVDFVVYDDFQGLLSPIAI